jgi:uncharacterized membrane protein
MAFCADCGAALSEEAGFCGRCGKAVAAASQATGAVGQTVTASAAALPGFGLTSNVAAALAYILGFITGIIFLVLEPYKSDPFVRFHAMQSILFNVAYVMFWILWSILWGLLEDVMGWWLLSIHAPLSLLIGLGMFLLWFYLMYQAYSQREFRIPVIGAIAAKQLA